MSSALSARKYIVSYRIQGDSDVMSSFLSMSAVLVVMMYVKGKGFPYSLPNVGPMQSWSRLIPISQPAGLTISHPPGGRLPLLSARPAVTFPAEEHYGPLAGAKLYCLVSEAHKCEQLSKVYTQLLPQ